jgi:outer membrane protein insertion porin family
VGRGRTLIISGAILAIAPVVFFGQAGTPKAGAPKAAKAKPKVKSAAPASSSTGAPAKEAASQPTAFPLESIRIEGNRRISSPRIIAASGLKIGTPVQKTDFDQARDRLVDTGAFENVGYEFKPNAAQTGFELTFQVVEVDQVFAYRFEDLPVPEDRIRAALRQSEPIFDDKIPPANAVLARFTKVIQEVAGVSVTGAVNSELPGEAVILFRPPGQRAVIAEVRFTGNSAVPSTLLARTMSGVAIGRPYTEPGFRQMLEASLRPVYEARGRIRVAFPKVTAEKAEKVDGLVVTVAVDEGSVYKLGQIRWSGVVSNLQADVEKAASFKKDDIVNFDDIQAGMERVHQRYLSAGFLKQASRVDRDIREAEMSVDLTVVIDPGPQYTFGKLTIQGLDIFSEPVIRKMWRLESGRPFQNPYPDAFLERVRQEDLFDNLGKTRAETNIDESSHVVDVTLFFSGAAADAKEKQKGRRP